MAAAGRPLDDIRGAIAAAGGAVPFSPVHGAARCTAIAGFYTGRAAAGPAGGATSSPRPRSVRCSAPSSPGALDAEWERLGRPDPFTVVEAGAGPGTLARSRLRRRAGLPRRRTALRRGRGVAPRSGRPHPAGVESRRRPAAGPFDGVVLANELLDNLPFRLVVYDGGWREAFVTTPATTAFAEVLAPLDPVPAGLPAIARPRARGRRCRTRPRAWVDAARAPRPSGGAVVVIDYARPTTGRARRPSRGGSGCARTAATSGAATTSPTPGAQDITADVAIDQLPEPDAVRTQAQFLQRHGIDELVEEGRRAWTAAAGAPDLAALTMRSRVPRGRGAARSDRPRRLHRAGVGVSVTPDGAAGDAGAGRGGGRLASPGTAAGGAVEEAGGTSRAAAGTTAA